MDKKKRSYVKSILKPFRFKIITIVVILILSFCLSLYMPIALKGLIDSGVMNKELKVVLKFSLILFAIYMADSVVRYFNSLMANALFFSIANYVKYSVAEFITTLPISYLNDKKPGELASLVNSDSQSVALAVNQINAFIFDIVSAGSLYHPMLLQYIPYAHSCSGTCRICHNKQVCVKKNEKADVRQPYGTGKNEWCSY